MMATIYIDVVAENSKESKKIHCNRNRRTTKKIKKSVITEIEEKQKKRTFGEISLKYNEILRILCGIGLIGIVLGFTPSIYRYIVQRIWLKDPIINNNEHPFVLQYILSLHTISCIIYTILYTLQIFLGSYMMNHNQEWIGRKFHRFVGRYILPLFIFLMIITPLWILYYKRLTATATINDNIFIIGGSTFILIWSFLGYYFIYKNQYLKHKDCMIQIWIISFTPAIFRMIKYTFQVFHYIIYGFYCIDKNPFPYIMISGMICMLIVGITFNKVQRLTIDYPHNIACFICTVLIVIVPMFTMDINWNPCVGALRSVRI